MKSLPINIVSSYVSQIYVTIVGIVMLPLYVRYMGAEAYGLVGFFATLQAAFQLLDMGMTPTIARQTAQSHGLAGGAHLRELLRALEGVFVCVALAGVAAMFFGAQYIAMHWLQVGQLPIDEVANSLRLMAGVVGLRFIAGLYRGAITGFEALVWLSGFNIVVATFRFVLVLPLFWLAGAAPARFFEYQLVVALFEAAGLIAKSYALLPARPAAGWTKWRWGPLREVLQFSMTIAFTSGVWILITQVDKLVLSKLLPLGEYGYFTIAVVVANGVVIIGGPLSNAILPRMTRMASGGAEADLLALYRAGSQLASVIAVSASIVLAFFARPILAAWTGDAALAAQAAPILSLYAVGNGLLAMSAFPYYLQFAKGDLRLHVIGNCLFVLFLIPIIIYASIEHGALGAGTAWAGMNVVYFFGWVPLVHRRLAPGLHARWLFSDVGAPALAACLMAGAALLALPWDRPRLQIGLQIALVGSLCLSAAALAASRIRSRLLTVLLRTSPI